MKYAKTLSVMVVFVGIFAALFSVVWWSAGGPFSASAVAAELTAVDSSSAQDADDDDDADDELDDDGRRVAHNAVPAPVRQTLRELVGHDDFGVWQEREHGMVVYEGRWVEDDVEVEAEVTADGVLLELEETLPATAVPEAVLRAVGERIPTATDVSFVKMTVYLYEVEAVVDGRLQEFTVLPNGSVVMQDD